MARHAWLAGVRFADLFPAAPVAAQAQPIVSKKAVATPLHGPHGSIAFGADGKPAIKRNCPPPSWMFPEDEQPVSGADVSNEPSNDAIWQMWRDAEAHVLSFARSLLRRFAAQPQPSGNPGELPTDDAQRWQKARTLPRSWWIAAFNRIAAEGVTLDELVDAEMRRKLP